MYVQILIYKLKIWEAKRPRCCHSNNVYWPKVAVIYMSPDRICKVTEYWTEAQQKSQKVQPRSIFF